MLNLTPIKTASQDKPVRRVKDLNIKLLNLFDAYDEQQDLIKIISKPSLESSKILFNHSTTSKPKFVNYFATQEISKIRPITSTMEKPSTPNLTNFTISSLTNRFNEYRHKNKALNTEVDPLEEQYKLEGPKPFPISSMKKPKLVVETSQSPSKKPTTLSLASIYPKTVQSNTMKVDFLMQAKQEKKLTLDSQRKYDSSERHALNRTGQNPDKGNSTHRSSQRPMSSYVETHGPWKLHGVRKVDLSDALVRGQSTMTSNSKLGGGPPSSRRNNHNFSIDLKNVNSELVRTSPGKGNISLNKTEFRIKKVIGESTLNPPKVTGNQKQRLTDFLHDEFVEEVINNKHNARNFYDGEALTNLNDLKKMINSHPQVRQNMYGNAGSTSRRESLGNANKKDQDLPTDAPRLKQFELSDPENVMLGIRPKNFISLNNGPVGEQERNIKPKETESSETPGSLTQLGKKAKGGFQALKDAIDVRKARGKKIRISLRELLMKYSRLGISLQDLREINDIFPKRPYDKKGAYSFMRAVKSGDYVTVKEYLQENKYFVFEFDPIKQTALHWAAKRGHTKIAGLLLDFGADTDALDMGGKAPLYYAIKEKHADIVGRLLFSKANPWSTKQVDYKEICDDGRCLKYLNKSRQLAILLMFHAAKDRQAVWEKEAQALIAPIESTDVPNVKKNN